LEAVRREPGNTSNLTERIVRAVQQKKEIIGGWFSGCHYNQPVCGEIEGNPVVASFSGSPAPKDTARFKSHAGVNSSRSYSTALSSVASYETAPSVPRPGLGVRSLQSVPELERTEEEWQTFRNNPVLGTNTAERKLRWPNKSFPAFFEKVSNRNLASFSSYEPVQSLTEDQKAFFKDFMYHCLENVGYGDDEQASSSKDQRVTRGAKGLRDELQDNVTSVAGNNAAPSTTTRKLYGYVGSYGVFACFQPARTTDANARTRIPNQH
jgi:hypothetical protein